MIAELERICCPICGCVLGEWAPRRFVSDHKGRRMQFRGSGEVLVQCSGRHNGTTCGQLITITLDNRQISLLA